MKIAGRITNAINGIVLLVFLLIGAGLVLLIYISTSTPSNEQTEIVPDSFVPTPQRDLRLDAFREQWNIRGDFQEWPALIPLAKISEAAYDLEPANRSIVEPFGFDEIQKIESPFHSQVAYIISGEDVMVIAFRGTDEGEDWLTNAGVYLRQMDLGKIHSGFSTAYSTLRPTVLDAVEYHRPKYLWITGHSLGGALAVVCAHDLTLFHNLELSGVITFGQPMIGNRDFTESLQERVGDRFVHFCNGLDAVPHTPLGLKHCGCLIWFKDGKIRKSANYLQLPVSAGPGQSPDPSEYEPIDELPPLSRRQMEEFKQTYDGDKDEPQKVMGAPPTSAPPRSSILDRVPWKADHDMDRYLEKLEGYYQK